MNHRIVYFSTQILRTVPKCSKISFVPSAISVELSFEIEINSSPAFIIVKLEFLNSLLAFSNSDNASDSFPFMRYWDASDK